MTASKEFMKSMRGPCVVCMDLFYREVDGVFHHFLPRNVAPMLQEHTEGGCNLCNEHHTYSNDIAPHSTNAKARRKFDEFCKNKYGDDYKDRLRELDRKLRNEMG